MYRQTLEILQGSVPDDRNKTSIAIKQVIILFTGGGSRFQFVKNTMSVKHSKAKYNKMKYACNEILHSNENKQNTQIMWGSFSNVMDIK